jgi:hypothetical protein
MEYAIERLRWHDVYTKFNKDWVRHSKADGGGGTQTHRKENA